jgi:hypothetical protein
MKDTSEAAIPLASSDARYWRALQGRADSEHAFKEKPGSAERAVSLGPIYLRLGNIDLALTTLHNAISLGGDDPYLYYFLGFVLMEKGDGKRGKEQWEYARLQDPEGWRYRVEPVSGCAPRSENVGRRNPREDSNHHSGAAL